MIEESKNQRLEAFNRVLEADGYDIVEAQPQRRSTITERINPENDDPIGFVVVETPVEIRDHEFTGDVVLTVFEDRLSSHGVDIYSDPEDPLSEEQQTLLSELVPPRDVTDDDGKTRRVWTYFAPPDDLPDSVMDDSRDNIDEVMAEFESVYETLT